MRHHAFVLVVNLLILSAGCAAGRPRVGTGSDMVFPRVAELEIDPAQLERYTAAVREEMETSVRIEPGVLAIYAVAEKDHPHKLRFFEMYDFRKYVEVTQREEK